MKTYKKGISLIVLVITVIVLAILATTVIVSLSNTNIISEARDAVEKSNLKAYQEQAALAYASWKLDNKSAILTDVTELVNYGFKASDLPSNYIVYIENGVPQITIGSVWDGTTVATDFARGTGTETDPYIIETAAQLAYFASYVNDGNDMEGEYVELANNIDLNGKEWTPIGDFIGYFDGNNNTIFNINVNNNTYAGLFSYMYGGVQNLIMNGGSVSGQYAGALCGEAEPWISDARIYNVKNIGVSVSGTNLAGGIIGEGLSDVVIENCENTGYVSSPTGSAGGIAGFPCLGSVVLNCVNRGNVTGKYASGIGEDGTDLTVENCTNYGNVHGTIMADAISVSRNTGEYREWLIITNCTNAGTVTVDEGGIVTNNGNFGVPLGSAWNGTIAKGFARGTGTKTDPYIIETAAQLAYFASYVNDGNDMEGEYIELTNNIDLNFVNWTPIGTSDPFAGYFDGNNNTIFNINVSNDTYAGLFDSIYGRIQNLIMNGGRVSGRYAGALCGYAEFGDDSANLYNVKNIGVSILGTYLAGGIIGEGQSDSFVENCENTGTVSSPTGSAGGIAGMSTLGSVVSNCINRGNVTGKYASGIAEDGEYLTVEDCANYGNIHGTTIADAISVSTGYQEELTVTNCTNAGTVTVDSGGTITNNGNVTM